VHPVDPGAGQVAQPCEVGLVRQPRRLEAAHLADRRGGAGEASPVDDGPHRRIDGKTFGVVDVLVTGKTTEDRLAQQPGQDVPPVPAAPQIRESRTRTRRQTERLVQLAIGEEPGV